MNMDVFIYGPVLDTVLLFCCAGIVCRILLSISRLPGYRSHDQVMGPASGWAVFSRTLLPSHRLIFTKPVFVLTRYSFHAGLMVLPLFISGHNVILDINYGFSFPTLPDPMVDGLTVAVIGTGGLLLIRRISSGSLKPGDYLLFIIALAPFATGFAAFHQMGDYRFWIMAHVISGEIMLLTAVFLFVRARITPSLCTGCGACTGNCPTGTLDFKDSHGVRTMSYSHYQCICCATCQATCPEQAIDLSHHLSFKRFFDLVPRPFQSVDLAECEACGAYFAPAPQQDRVKKNIGAVQGDLSANLDLCLRCRALRMVTRKCK